LEFNWRPGIGDPTIGGWVTVVLYVLACVSCWWTSHTLRSTPEAGEERNTWLAIATLFAFLGINKQLDLQTALTEMGRVLAYSEDWYAQRRQVQVAFIIGVAGLCLVTILLLLVWARRSPYQTWLALTGSCLVIGYVLIRAASFHHIDRFIDRRILGFKWNWVLEMSGIGIVLLASEWRRANRRCQPWRASIGDTS
jgi:uncharacterized membrane protein YqjE